MYERTIHKYEKELNLTLSSTQCVLPCIDIQMFLIQTTTSRKCPTLQLICHSTLYKSRCLPLVRASCRAPTIEWTHSKPDFNCATVFIIVCALLHRPTQLWNNKKHLSYSYFFTGNCHRGKLRSENPFRLFFKGRWLNGMDRKTEHRNHLRDVK